MIRLLLGILLLCVCTSNLYAQKTGGGKGGETGTNASETPVVTGDVYAIIIGISKYNEDMSPLQWADKDARYFESFLKSPAGGSVKEANIKTFVNDSAKAQNINTWLHRKIRKGEWPLKKGDRLYIFFSGHGDSYDEEYYYLMSQDSRGLDVISSNGSSPSAVLDVLWWKKNFIKPAVDNGVQVVLIIDACRTKEIKTSEAKPEENFFQRNQYGEIAIVSTSEGKAAFEHQSIGDGGQGLFTFYLLEGLYGAADSLDEHDGYISFSEIKNYLDRTVVKSAKDIFKQTQVPKYYYKFDNDFLINRADNQARNVWLSLRQEYYKLKKETGTDEKMHLAMVTKAKKGGVNFEGVDSNLVRLYNRFSQELGKENLVGEESAEAFYNRMKSLSPVHSLTEDARYQLATELVNFCQQKINLFLSGKGVLHMQRMEEDLNRTFNDTVRVDIDGKETSSKNNMVQNVAEEIKKIKVIATTRFDVAAEMIEKAMSLLNDDPLLLESIKPKFNFLKAAALSNETAPEKIREGIVYCRKAIADDPKAAYNYLIMGWLLDAVDNDSSAVYYERAVQLAPTWAIAHNNLGYYYTNKKKNKKALEYFKKAIELDTLYTNAYNHIGNIYYYTNTDSALFYYQKALEAEPCYVHAMGNLGLVYMNAAEKSGDANYKRAEQYFKNAIACDPSYAWSYRKLADLYETFQGEKYRDTAITYLRKWIQSNPESKESSPYQSLADLYLKKGDTASARRYQKLGLERDPANVDNYIAMAKFYAKLGQDKAAVEIYHKALKIEQSSTVYNAIGNFYYTRKADSAIKYYKLALQKEPNSSTINYNLSILYSELEQFEKAIHYNELAIKAAPDDASLYHAMGHIYQKLDGEEYEKKAIEYFEATTLLDSTDTEAYSHLGSLYKAAGRYQLSVKYFKKALELDPKNHVTYKNVATVYYSLEEFNKAEGYMREAIALDPENPDLHHTLGHIQEKKKANAEALKSYKKALALDATNIELYVHIAGINKAEGKLPTAIEHLKKAILVDSTDQDLYYDIGQLYEKLDDASSALHYYRQGLEYNLEHGKLCTAIADIYRKRKDYLRAESYYLQALVANPKDAYVYHQLGHVYYNRESYKNAILCYEKSIEFDPKDKEVLRHLTDYFTEVDPGDERAEKYLLLLLEVEQSASIFQQLGTIYYAKEDYKKAIENFEKAYRLDPGNFNILTSLGYCYLTFKQNYELARFYYQKAAKIEPKSANVHYNLACIYALEKTQELAFVHLELAFKYDRGEGEDSLIELSKGDADLKNLRSDARYQQLIRKYDD